MDADSVMRLFDGRKQLVTREQAKEQGLKRFFTGVPCLHGHICERFLSNGCCVICTYAADRRTKEQHAEKAKRMWAKHREKRSAENKAAYAKNIEYHKARAKAWMQANPERVRQRNLLRWHLKRSLAGNFSKLDLDRIRSEQRDKCAFCKTKLSGRGSLDHIVPISKGGTNEPRNLQWLCKPCNSSKQAHDQIDWARSKGLLL